MQEKQVSALVIPRDLIDETVETDRSPPVSGKSPG